jgi:Arc/MetJ-type ribon-helix-helix transcriptional regulator
LNAAVADGAYASPVEAFHDALQGWQDARQANRRRLTEIRSLISQSLSDSTPSLTDAEVDAHLATLMEADGPGDFGP